MALTSGSVANGVLSAASTLLYKVPALPSPMKLHGFLIVANRDDDVTHYCNISIKVASTGLTTRLCGKNTRIPPSGSGQLPDVSAFRFSVDDEIWGDSKGESNALDWTLYGALEA